MVLESIVSEVIARRHPSTIFFMALILSSVSIWVSFYVFPNSSSILPLAFVTIGFVPIIHKMFVEETMEEVEKPGWAPAFITRHFELVLLYAFLFLGLIASYTLWYVVLPSAETNCIGAEKALNCGFPTREKIFSEQENVFSKITGRAVGANECKNPATKSIEKCTFFIFSNNSFVLVLAIMFSFLFGAGAIFLIGWNASVIGTFIGKEVVEVHALAGLLRGISYLPHGMWEITGYFMGAIAGGIISAVLSGKTYGSHQFETIAKDTLSMIIIAYILLFIGAAIEAWLIVG